MLLLASMPGLLWPIAGAREASGQGRNRGAEVSREQVERSLKLGVDFLLRSQRADGTWGDETGETALVTLALLTSGESPRSEPMVRALNALRVAPVNRAHETYTVALMTMAFAQADPAKYREDIFRQAEWIEQGQLANGAWTYNQGAGRGGGGGDNSNSQYALLGLQAASDAGFGVNRNVWRKAQRYWESTASNDGGWGYTPGQSPTGSMTCAGISSLIITGLKRVQTRETINGNRIDNCGEEEVSITLQRGIDWLATHFDVRSNPGKGNEWLYYYLYGLERAGRLSGRRFFGANDWYREGAAYLVQTQEPVQGFWNGQNGQMVNTSFGVLFLAKGRSGVLVNKLRHGPGADWNNDHDDVNNLVGVVAKDWKHPLTWQIINPESATVEDLLQAPIVYFNGHESPEFSAEARRKLREYVDQGGVIVADACCNRREFRQGFEALMREIFPEPDSQLHPLLEDHPIWRARYNFQASSHPLWGIEQGCRTVVIYSPDDLSCFWNQLETAAANPEVRAAVTLGLNIVDYVTGRELPADKLAPRDLADFKQDRPQRGSLQIAKLRHAGDWNIAPLAIPNLTTMLRDRLKFDVVINQKDLFSTDPSLVFYPLIYVHGRKPVEFSDADKAAMRKHLSNGGTLFADSACGSTGFDASFRQFVADLLPGNPLVPIGPADEFYGQNVGFVLDNCQQTPAAGGKVGLPELEGVKIDGRWVIFYSKLDLGCALQKQAAIDCKGYVHESAARIATNIVIYATQP